MEQTDIFLKGRIEHITYRNEENGYTVLDLDSDGELVTVVGIMPPVAEGEHLSARGLWVFNQRFGKQFSAESVECELPQSLDEIFSYLASGDIKGIGPKTAEKIIEKFKEDSLDVIENHPDILSQIPGISLNKAEQISQSYKERFGVREIIMRFKKYGISNSEAIRIYKVFGASSISKVENNPYVLSSNVGFSFDRADDIAEKLDKKLMDFRTVAGIKHILQHNANLNGHTCIPKDKLIPLVAQFLDYSSDDVELHLDLATDKGDFIIKEFDGEEFVFLRSLYDAENSVARKLITRINLSFNVENDLSKQIKNLEKRENIKYNPLQIDAIESAVNRGMLVLTGGPGTGKTTTLKAIIEILKSQDEDIVLCAPTGKAAKRMEEVCGYDARTIHRLLEASFVNGVTYFGKDKDNKISCDTIIIDEMSMVDIKLFAALCDALPLSSRIIMVGDSDQLPSVGAGAVLSDIIKSGKIPTVELNTVFRQAEESLIVTNAHRIICGENPVVDDNNSDFFFLRTNNKYDTVNLVANLYCNRLPKSYEGEDKEIQILCPSRMMEEGSVNINQIIQNIINPPDESKKEMSVSPFILREGDRVMQIKNDYDIVFRYDDLSEGLGIFNGETGVIEKISNSRGEIYIRYDNKLATYNHEQIKNVELCYATTIHKSQGSEYDCVVIPIFDAPEKLCYRNLLYTGITRAKSRLILVGNYNTICKMVANDKKTLRYTALEKLLR